MRAARIVHADVIAALEARLAAVEAALAAVTSQPRPAARGPRDRDDAAVVLALAAAISRAAAATGEPADSTVFRARDVRRLATLDIDLRRALVAADATSARSIGKLLSRVEGHAIGGAIVTRCHGTTSTARWRLAPVTSVSSV
jgi:hypothetical protein